MQVVSQYFIVAIVAIIVATYVIALWRKVSFAAATVVANAVIFILYYAFGDQQVFRDVVETLGSYNSSLETGENLWGLFTHMFIHANFLHLIFNMFIFFLMGTHFEERVGWRNMAIVYFGSGVLGAGILNGIVTLPGGEVIGIGASGAVSGVIGAFAIMYPNDRVPMVLGFILLPRVQVAFGALVFIAFETFLMFFAVSLPGIGNVSHTAHLAGVIVGAIIGFVMHKMGVEAPERGAATTRRLDRLDLEKLRELVRQPAHIEKLEALIGEDIPEVREVLLEDLVSRLRCPQCSSIMTLKGHTLRCEGFSWSMDLRMEKQG